VKTTLGVAFGLLLACSAQANGPEIGIDAGMVIPVASANVELEREWVDIHAALGMDGTLECMYRLRNRSHKARTVPMGFVVAVPSTDPVNSPSHWDDPALGLEVHYPSGTPIPVRREAARKRAWREIAEAMPDSLPVFDVPVPPESSVTFMITSRITWSGGSDGEHHGVILKYVATPARLWAGPIGHAEIAFHFSDLEVALLRQAWETTRFVEDLGPGSVRVEIKPAGFTWTNDGVLWKFDHWEPRENPTVSIDWTDLASAD
jgi:hypothetical protein